MAGAVVAHSIRLATGNVTCTWNDSYKRYEIIIEGTGYYYLNYNTSITNLSGGRRFYRVSSVSSMLLIYPTDESGIPAQGNFSFEVTRLF